jgi:hypothetical protein
VLPSAETVSLVLSRLNTKDVKGKKCKETKKGAKKELEKEK